MEKELYPDYLKEKIRVVRIENSSGTALEILNFGASIFSLRTKDSNGTLINIVVSPRKPEDFLSREYKRLNKCFGASVGRYAGRISQGSILTGDKLHQLYQKDGVHLHGGDFGFAYRLWEVEDVTEGPDPSVLLSYFSRDGEEGYPGNLTAKVRYTLREKDEVEIEYWATTDKETVVNLTNHTYFNLNGSSDVKGHMLQIDSEKVLEVNEKLLPSGNFLNTAGTAMDFSQSRKIGDQNLDDVFALRKKSKPGIALKGEESGLTLEIITNQPAVVVYLPKKLPSAWDYHTHIAEESPAVALETQNFPDSPHHKNFPSSKLKPGKEYYNRTMWNIVKKWD